MLKRTQYSQKKLESIFGNAETADILLLVKEHQKFAQFVFTQKHTSNLTLKIINKQKNHSATRVVFTFAKFTNCLIEHRECLIIRRKFMSLIELDNSAGGLRKIKEELKKLTIIFSCISVILFAAYYSYLMVKNIDEPLYLIIYSILFVVVLAMFMVESLVIENKNTSRKKKREVVENKRRFKLLIKTPKYIAKSILVGLAIFETINNFDLGISNIINILLAIVLVIQIIFEVVAHYLTYYMDYLMMCVKKDIEESQLVQFIDGFRVTKKIGDKLEDLAYKANGEDKFTKQEQEMYKEIDKWKDVVEKEKKEENKGKIIRGTKGLIKAGKEKIQKILPKKEK